MSEYIEVGQPLQFTDPNTPTRVGEIVETVSDIYNIPSPRLGMQVFVKSEKKSFVITSLKSKNINGVDVPEAAVEAFEAVGAKAITWNNDTDPSDMDDFVVAGVYDIKGIVGNNRGNLPIMNTGENASFAARLVVTVSPEGDTTYRHSIGQTMVVSNSEGKETKVYTRNANVTSYDGGVSYVYEWGNWGELQKNVNVEAVTSLDHLVDNGIYSGVLTPTGETFVLVVINNYALASQHGTQKCISQFKYSVSPFGAVAFGKRVKIGNADFPAEWDILNRSEIDKMLEDAVKQAIANVVNGAPETFDTLKEIADWIANDETGAVALANAISANAAAITAERTRAIGQEGLLNNAIAEEKSRAEQAEQTIKEKAVDADSLNFITRANVVALDYHTIEGVGDEITIPAATATTAGVMSAKDKRTLDAVNSVINIGEYQNIQAVWDACKQVALNNPEISIIKYSVKAGRTYNSGIVFQMYYYNDAIVTQYYLYGGGQKHECNVRHIVSDGTTDNWQPIQMFTSYKFENGTLYGYKYGKSESEQNKVPIVDIPNNGSAIAELMQEVTYDNLVMLRDTNKLVAGTKYRITDYVTTTVQKDTKSANHPFDVIVEAISENELSELAQAIQHEGDTYFEGNDLGAWQLWYDLDNDTEKYAWADAENGKGVIYRMIDEKRNDCPYDFKNILFKRYILNADDAFETDYPVAGLLDVVRSRLTNLSHKIATSLWYYGDYVSDVYPDADPQTKYVPFGDVTYDINGPGVLCPINESSFEWFYTFHDNSKNSDASLGYIIPEENLGVYRNEILENHNIFENIQGEGSVLQTRNTCVLNDIVLIGNYCNSNSFGNDCYSNSFGNYCNSNSFGNYCNYNSFGNDCNSNSFGNYCNSNSFGNDCKYNSFGNYCNSNSFGNECNSNSFGNDCYSNSFGNYCKYNSFGNDCNSNSFGNYCNSNSFGNDCNSNSFGNYCNSNSFGNECNSNSFGNYCNSNSFGNYCYYNSFGNYCYYNSFGNYCYYNSFGNNCNSNSFGNECSYNGFYDGNSYFFDDSTYEYRCDDVPLDYVQNNKFGDGCNHLLIYTNNPVGADESIQNLNIAQGFSSVSKDDEKYVFYPEVIEIEVVGQDYELKIARNTGGEVKIYCEADLV